MENPAQAPAPLAPGPEPVEPHPGGLFPGSASVLTVKIPGRPMPWPSRLGLARGSIRVWGLILAIQFGSRDPRRLNGLDLRLTPQGAGRYVPTQIEQAIELRLVELSHDPDLRQGRQWLVWASSGVGSRLGLGRGAGPVTISDTETSRRLNSPNGDGQKTWAVKAVQRLGEKSLRVEVHCCHAVRTLENAAGNRLPPG